ncbi:MAG TPA: class I SAM-dependent methyltransferase [Melioribacteraceae bacterium]|nr:class I SAM-dependent methyltransferase [Melioribacteraceae bacterium]
MDDKFKLSFKQVNKLVNFIEAMGDDTEVEEPTLLHTQLIESFIKVLYETCPSDKYKKVLDIGCGSGVALEELTKYGYNPIGISINKKEIEICKSKGYKAELMDQSFLEFEDKTFNIIWARHVLEHSIMPVYTLNEFKRVLKDDGVLYIEVPSPSTPILHENNPYHFSMFTKNVWTTLFIKAGFKLIYENIISFAIPQADGKEINDEYVNFYLIKNDAKI